jgi:hypothetical protein
MASRSKVKKKAQIKKDKKFSKEIKYLEKLVVYSLKNINGKSKELDDLFIAQAKRLKSQIKKLEQDQ